jgi:phosphatidylinositol-bisphosphatase
MTHLVSSVLYHRRCNCSVGLNKGGAAISFKLDDTHLAFVSSHLAAHQSKTAQRNADVGEICANLKLLPPRQRRSAHRPDVATAFHHLVWVGDLNYRLEYGQQVRGECIPFKYNPAQHSM